MRWTFVADSVGLAIQDAQLAEHGGIVGIRDEGLLSSALARSHNLLAYGESAGAVSLADSYAFGISRNHPFFDGNKRTAFVVIELFLDVNGWVLKADDADCISTMEVLASGNLNEKGLGSWLRGHAERKRKMSK